MQATSSRPEPPQRHDGASPDNAFNLFAEEEQIAAEATRTLADSPLPETARQSLSRLLEGYHRLLRDSKQLIRIADHRERDLNRLNKKLESLTRSLAYQAEHDALTGALNKGAITQRITQQLGQSEGCLMLMDIDHFKRVNDIHGHLVGDQILKMVTDRLQDQLDDSEVLGRFGGEEFILLSRQTSLLVARQRAEVLRRGVADEGFLTSSGIHLNITLSIGLTLSLANENATQVMARTDLALYEAKHRGRNRVEVHLPALN